MYGKHGHDTRIVIYGVIHAVPAHEEHPAANSRAGGLVVRIIFLAIIRIAAEDLEHCADPLIDGIRHDIGRPYTASSVSWTS